ncbi:MAG: dienelactone hydrolase family protein [Anaerolineaceae bacterium]|nr:dienelactone hydrolase family protein [Anaerolineaceae bacterium]
MRKQRKKEETRVLFELPTMKKVWVTQDIPYLTTPEHTLKADFYSPRKPPLNYTLPAIILVSGDSGSGHTHVLKSNGQYTSWGRIFAAAGMVAVNFNHHSTENLTKLDEIRQEVRALIEFVHNNAAAHHIDPQRIAIWTCSAGPPYAFDWVLKEQPAYVRCLIAYYGLMDLAHMIGESDPPEVVEMMKQFTPSKYLSLNPSGTIPIQVVKAGLDRSYFRKSMDTFLEEAEKLNIDLDFIDHPEATHGFELRDGSKRTGQIIHQTLRFLKKNL